VVEQEPVAVRTVNAAVPLDLETICAKCLQKEPERRYESAQALADDLSRYLRGEPILARPIGQLSRGWRWCRRNPKLAFLIAAVWVSLFAGAMVSTYFGVQAHRSARDARDRLRGSLLAQAQANRWSGRAGRRFESLK